MHDSTGDPRISAHLIDSEELRDPAGDRDDCFGFLIAAVSLAVAFEHGRQAILDDVNYQKFARDLAHAGAPPDCAPAEFSAFCTMRAAMLPKIRPWNGKTAYQ